MCTVSFQAENLDFSTNPCHQLRILLLQYVLHNAKPKPSANSDSDRLSTECNKTNIIVCIFKILYMYMTLCMRTSTACLDKTRPLGYSATTSPIQNIFLSVFLTDRIVIHLSIDYDEKFDGLRTTCAVSIETVASLQDNSPAELGLRGCKNWPAPFPGRMSYVCICVVSCPCVISYPTIMARYSLFVLKVPLNPKQPTNLAHSTVEFLHEETHGVCVCVYVLMLVCGG